MTAATEPRARQGRKADDDVHPARPQAAGVAPGTVTPGPGQPPRNGSPSTRSARS
jgi:hypothetical protein